MNVIALILWIAAAAFFVVAWYVPRFQSVALALLTVGIIFEFGARSHSISF